MQRIRVVFRSTNIADLNTNDQCLYIETPMTRYDPDSSL